MGFFCFVFGARGGDWLFLLWEMNERGSDDGEEKKFLVRKNK